MWWLLWLAIGVIYGPACFIAGVAVRDKMHEKDEDDWDDD